MALKNGFSGTTSEKKIRLRLPVERKSWFSQNVLQKNRSSVPGRKCTKKYVLKILLPTMIQVSDRRRRRINFENSQILDINNYEIESQDGHHTCDIPVEVAQYQLITFN